MFKGETLRLAISAANTTAVEYRFGGPESRTVQATKSGSDFTIQTSTAQWAPGAYAWQAWATDVDGIVAVIARGKIDLEEVLGVGDVRTSARKMVEMIEAMMAGNASAGVRRYKINNRELERYSVAELLQLLSYWKEQVQREDRAESGRSIFGPRISIRF
jgi:hypothetical protein